MEETTKKINWNTIRWGLLIVLSLALIYQFLGKGQSTGDNSDEDNIAQLNDNPGNADAMAKPELNPEAAMTAPAVGERNAYTPMKDFDGLMKANLNKSDFNFFFEDFKETPIYDLNDGKIDFVLKGWLKTRQDLSSKVSLNIEFYSNDQASFARRQATRAFDFPYINASAKKDKNNQYQYDFDFKKSFELNKGLYYFTIIPNGRNRVMYTNKFEVR